MKKMVIWGSSGQAKVLQELMAQTYDVIAIGDKDDHAAIIFKNAFCCHSFAELQKFIADYVQQETIYFAVAVAGIYRGLDRWQIHNSLKQMKLIPQTLIHTESYVAANAQLGEGCQILAKAAVCAEVSMEEQCIINTSATVDHESRLGKSVHLCPGAHVLGDVTIKDYATIGAGAVILPHLTIGESAIIGAGSIILHDVPARAVVVGNPGKIINYIPS